MKKLIRVGVTARSAVVPHLAARRVFEFLNAKQALFALILALLFTPAVHAATLTWNCADSYWDITSCWSPTGLPTSLDDVYLNPVSGGTTLLEIDAITGNAYANTVTVASSIAGAPVTLQQTGGSLNTNSETIGAYGTGAFIQNGGTHTVSGNLFLGTASGGSGTYTMNGGTLTVGRILTGDGLGIFNLDGGTLNLTGDSIINVDAFNVGNAAGSNGSFTLGSGQSLTAVNESIGVLGMGSLFQSGGTNTVAGLLTINGTYGLSGGTLEANGSMDNSGTLALSGGMLAGSGALANNNLVSGYGTLAGSGGFTNNALITQSGGHITLANTGANANYGNIDLAAGYQLRLTGATLNNGGTINLNSSVIAGTGTLNNSYGGTIAGRGTISSNFSNSGGVVAVTSGTTNITQAFANNGAIQLGGPTANLAGGAINNTGTIEGVGNVGNSISSTGIIRAGSGTLTLSGASVNNNTDGLMTASTGGTLLVTNGMVANAGVISLAGGAFDNNNNTLANSGEISGYGTLRTGGLSNSGSMTLTGGTTTVNGDVTNQAGGTIEVAHNPAIFTGDVVNEGMVKTTNTTVTFAGGYMENGVFISDPSNNYFTDVTIGSSGYWTGGVGDNFYISGNFVNNSLQNTLWNTGAASLFFNGAGDQNLYLAGSDLGTLYSGYSNNFAWGEFSLDSGTSIHLFDGNSDPTAALYVGLFELGDGLTQLGSIYSDYNIYYDPNAAGNAYLGGQQYALNGSGFLLPAAVPIPPAVWLFCSGLLGLVGVARRHDRPSSRV